MATKKRRTRTKILNESSDDDDDSSYTASTPVQTRRLKEISYVKREKEENIRRTQKLVSRVCDPEDESDNDQRRPRPMNSLTINVSKKSRKHQSDSDEEVEPVNKTITNVPIPYASVDTPGKSDDENIKVDIVKESKFKSMILEEINQVRQITLKIAHKLKYDLKNSGTYLSNKKKISSVRDGKFLLHKVLTLYDDTFKEIKKSRDKFLDSYDSWKNTCKENSFLDNVLETSSSNDDIVLPKLKKSKTRKDSDESSLEEIHVSDSSDKSERNKKRLHDNSSSKGITRKNSKILFEKSEDSDAKSTSQLSKKSKKPKKTIPEESEHEDVNEKSDDSDVHQKDRQKKSTKVAEERAEKSKKVVHEKSYDSDVSMKSQPEKFKSVDEKLDVSDASMKSVPAETEDPKSDNLESPVKNSPEKIANTKSNDSNASEKRQSKKSKEIINEEAGDSDARDISQSEKSKKVVDEESDDLDTSTKNQSKKVVDERSSDSDDSMKVTSKKSKKTIDDESNNSDASDKNHSNKSKKSADDKSNDSINDSSNNSKTKINDECNNSVTSDKNQSNKSKKSVGEKSDESDVSMKANSNKSKKTINDESDDSDASNKNQSKNSKKSVDDESDDPMKAPSNKSKKSTDDECNDSVTSDKNQSNKSKKSEDNKSDESDVSMKATSNKSKKTINDESDDSDASNKNQSKNSKKSVDEKSDESDVSIKATSNKSKKTIHDESDDSDTSNKNQSKNSKKSLDEKSDKSDVSVKAISNKSKKTINDASIDSDSPNKNQSKNSEKLVHTRCEDSDDSIKHTSKKSKDDESESEKESEVVTVDKNVTVQNKENSDENIDIEATQSPLKNNAHLEKSVDNTNISRRYSSFEELDSTLDQSIKKNKTIEPEKSESDSEVSKSKIKNKSLSLSISKQSIEKKKKKKGVYESSESDESDGEVKKSHKKKKKPLSRGVYSSSDSDSSKSDKENISVDPKEKQDSKKMEVDENPTAQVSECDSDVIFSGDESRTKKAKSISRDASPEIFDSSISEIPNSPVFESRRKNRQNSNLGSRKKSMDIQSSEDGDREISSSLSTVKDVENSNLDDKNLKKDLLHYSDSDSAQSKNKSSEPSLSSQDIDSECSTVTLTPIKKKQTKKTVSSSNSSNDTSSSSEDERRTKRKLEFNLFKNRHYKADKKLRMLCRVILHRLSKEKLKQHSKALEKSRKYIKKKEIDSLVNFADLETTKKKSKQQLKETELENVVVMKNSKKKSKVDEKKSVEDHLDKGSDIGSDNDLSEEEIETEQISLPDHALIEINIAQEAEEDAKGTLLNESSSNEENGDVMEVDEEEVGEVEKPVKEKKKKKEKTKKKSASEENGDENISEDEEEIEKKKEKAAWKQDELLTFDIADTDTEEEKYNKSQEKKKAKKVKAEEQNDKSANEKKSSDLSPIKTGKRSTRGRKPRRILDSDSDVKFATSDEESTGEEKQSASEGEEEEKKEEEEKAVKKKKGRKRRKKTSDSDSSSSEARPKAKRKRIKKVATDSESEQDSPGKGGRKNIRKVLKDKHVADDTKRAAQEEEERLKRIAERQRIFNEMYDARLAGEAKVDKLVLDFDEETKKELVVVHEELVKRLKPHQAQGIKFMWDACFESLKQMEESSGSGCIIAHCMGLGKTFQVVTLAHTLLTHEATGVQTVMVVCPLSTVLNWVNEFKTWLKHVKDGDEIEIYELTKLKKNIERKYMLESWHKTGGVLIIGYEMFRNLTSTGKKMRKAMQESVMRSLVDPGADLVVCDEGHLLKNEESALSKAMKLVRTMRRIVLTGTPLQNNLKEYHCMVQFVKPNLLGTKKEFLNRFVNPITNGQFDDSTPYDVKIMKKRAHVLHKMLEGSVQRFDYSVLTPFLPPKQEYVIFVRLTELQIKMYQHYLDNFARRYGGRNGSLFADFQELQRIWTHPYVLRLNAEKVEKAAEKKRLEASDSEGSLKDFIDDNSDSDVCSIGSSSSINDSDVQCVDSDDEKPVRKRSTRANPREEPVEEVPNQPTVEESPWWSQYVEEKDFEDMRISTKLVLLFGIIKECEQIGDKVLVFSQSLYSLTLIEQFLSLIDQETQNGEEKETLNNYSSTWTLGLDYFRLDGSTSAENRSIWCKIFNKPTETRARLFLISTRAGGLGINLTAANRVIIFDASWNPSHDVQSIFRIYRFGQKKPCYIYRFLAAGTMEEKIYNRQVTKLSLACRVVDEQQIERHYSNNDLAELYQFEPHVDEVKTLNLPKDRLLAEIFLKFKDCVYNYHEHDSLLENKEEEELDEEERKQAWQEYEEEKQGKRQIVNNMGNMGFNPFLMNLNAFPEMESIKALIQKDYPNLPPEHLDTVARQAVYDMYRFVDQQAISQALSPFAAGGQTMATSNMYQNPQTLQQQIFDQQNQMMGMNMLNQPQVNYPNVNQMPTYSGRGRPPKYLSMNNQMINNQMMNNSMMRQPLQSSMQVPGAIQQNQVPGASQNNGVEVLSERLGVPSSGTALNTNNQKED